MPEVLITFKSSEETNDSIKANFESFEMSVAELIRFSVVQYLSDLQLKRQIKEAQCREILARQFLCNKDIEEMLHSGKVAVPEKLNKYNLDASIEVKKALVAFEKNSFMLLVDGRQFHDLEEQVDVQHNSKILFIRLMQLVGG